MSGQKDIIFEKLIESDPPIKLVKLKQRTTVQIFKIFKALECMISVYSLTRNKFI